MTEEKREGGGGWRERKIWNKKGEKEAMIIASENGEE